MSPHDPSSDDGPAGGPRGGPEGRDGPGKTQPIDWEAFYANYRKPGYIDGFEITSKLGGGMFGLVFKAVRQSIGKDYAIKFLKVDDHDVRHAVLNELESVRFFAQVDHPNLVSIEDRGVVDGIPYIVMAYAGSETLRQRLDDPHVGADELLKLFVQACRGVHALHERSLVHFDLKPANIFIKGDVARVGDYGLSKLVSASRNSLSMGRGTPYYMAPEMLQRRGDFRSDVYSLGVILYECLTGEVPFKGDSEWEVLRAHETAQPAFPESMPEHYRAIILRCMAKAPEQRYGSVAEIVDALRSPSAATAPIPPVSTRVEPPPVPGAPPRVAPPPLPGSPKPAVAAATPRRVVVPPPIPEAFRKAPIGPDGDPQAIAAAAAANARRVVGELGNTVERRAIEKSARRAARARKRIERRNAQAARDRRGSARRGSFLVPLAGVAVLAMVGLAVVMWLSAVTREDAAQVRRLSFANRAMAEASHENRGLEIIEQLVENEASSAQATYRVTVNGQPVRAPVGLQAGLPDEWLRNQDLVDYPFGTGVGDRQLIREKVENLAVRTDFRPGYGRKIEEHGLAGLIGVVEYLQSLNMANPEDTRRAHRLVEFLGDWTGVESLEIIPIENDGYSGPDSRRYNLKGIAAWRAILERYCQDEDAFESFLERACGANPGVSSDCDDALDPEEVYRRIGR